MICGSGEVPRAAWGWGWAWAWAWLVGGVGGGWMGGGWVDEGGMRGEWHGARAMSWEAASLGGEGVGAEERIGEGVGGGGGREWRGGG